MVTEKKSRLFGGVSLKDIGEEVRDRLDPAISASPTSQPTLAAAELALRGRSGAPLERENILSVDPRRCRSWKYHNRSDAWYTKERCADLIDSVVKDGQVEPALARRLNGEPEFDYELIYGMRRRFAAEFTNSKLRIRVADVDDTRAAVLMHVENADRKDISPMERALSFQVQVEAKLFPTQDALADAFNISKGQVAKMLKAAGLLKHPRIAQLFIDRTTIPVEQAYNLAVALEREGAKEVILQAASNLMRKSDGSRTAAMTIKALLSSLDQSRRIAPLKREYNIGTTSRMIVTRNAKGKITVAFPKGVREDDRVGLLSAIDKMLKDLG